MVDGISGAGIGRLAAAKAQAGRSISTLQKPQAKSAEVEVAGASLRAAASEPPVDAAKVERIRTAIAEGRYPVDPQAIAQKMIDLDIGPGR